MTTVHNFTASSGTYPQGELRAANGNFYGTAFFGGPTDDGVIFKMTPAGVTTPIFAFDGTNGSHPTGGLVIGDDGNFYGVTQGDNASDQGTVFKLTPAGQLTTLVVFNGNNGATPKAGLLKGSDGNFYGTTLAGGTSAQGTIFKLTPSGTLSTLVNFNGPNGRSPYAGLIEARDGSLYGTTYQGGISDAGTVFRLNITSLPGQLTTLVSFNGTTAQHPYAKLLESSDGMFYGTTASSCNTVGCGYGTVFQMTPAGELSILVNFQNYNGAYPDSALVEASDGSFYGTTPFGGDLTNTSTSPYTGYGTIFRVTRLGELTTLKRFTDSEDALSPSGLIDGGEGNFYGTSSDGGQAFSGTVFKIASSGTFTRLNSFKLELGSDPAGSLFQASDGSFYGATQLGGVHGLGTVFRMSASGAVTNLASFDRPTNGSEPYGAPVEGADGNLYGTTANGGPAGYGTVYRMTPSGQLTVLVAFDSNNGYYATAPLIRGRDNNFYGTTTYGGSGGLGTVFKVTPQGGFSTLVAFNGTNGSVASSALIEDADGNLYGTTTSGGSFGFGTVFKVGTNGVLTTLASFDGVNGASPSSALLRTSDGSLYGYTTLSCQPSTDYQPECYRGTVFKLTTAGVLSRVTAFASGVQGKGRLILAADGNFYGTTQSSNGGESVFKLTPSGVLTTLEAFDNPGGAYPQELLLARDGNFYGMTARGGTADHGTIYRIPAPGGSTAPSGGGSGEGSGGGGGSTGIPMLAVFGAAGLLRRRYRRALYALLLKRSALRCPVALGGDRRICHPTTAAPQIKTMDSR